jgi:hypothetical protein
MVYLLKVVDLSMAMLVITRWYCVYSICVKYHLSIISFIDIH